jgi:hypothetical protein
LLLLFSPPVRRGVALPLDPDDPALLRGAGDAVLRGDDPDDPDDELDPDERGTARCCPSAARALAPLSL